MIVKTVNGKTPRWGKNCFIADNAALSGDCLLGDDCSVWYSAVLRSDVDAIRCGNRVNIQDCACIHQTGGMPCILEDDVSVGHGAVVHHCCWSGGATRHTRACPRNMGRYTCKKSERLCTRTSRNLCPTLCGIY